MGELIFYIEALLKLIISLFSRKGRKNLKLLFIFCSIPLILFFIGFIGSSVAIMIPGFLIFWAVRKRKIKKIFTQKSLIKRLFG